ncbi:hypothetical protein ABEB36_014044 [Hypothenemus hampei]|uniref:Uncharacterized protein n=1 Tax=Hypothenemus hampei TaxID=57062 RepID=A0ABD1E350_HYPHA
MVNQLEDHVHQLLLNIIRENPLIEIREIERRFCAGGALQCNNFVELGLGSLEYILIGTPFIYKDEIGCYFACGGVNADFDENDDDDDGDDDDGDDDDGDDDDGDDDDGDDDDDELDNASDSSDAWSLDEDDEWSDNDSGIEINIFLQSTFYFMLHFFDKFTEAPKIRNLLFRGAGYQSFLFHGTLAGILLDYPHGFQVR